MLSCLDEESGLILSKAGIPVWVVWTPIPRRQELSVDQWIDPPPDEPEFLPLWDDWELDCSDATSAHPVIYTGKAGSLDRYRTMSQYCHSLTNTNVYDDHDDDDAQSQSQSQSGPSRSSSTRPSSTVPCMCFVYVREYYLIVL